MNSNPGTTLNRNQGLQAVLISTLISAALMVLFSIFAWMKLAEAERMMSAFSFLVNDEELSQVRMSKYFVMLNIPCWAYLIYNCVSGLQRKRWARISLLVMFPLTLVYTLFVILVAIVMLNDPAMSRIQGYLGIFLLFQVLLAGICIWGLIAMLGRAARAEFNPVDTTATPLQMDIPLMHQSGAAPVDPQPPFPDNDTL